MLLFGAAASSVRAAEELAQVPTLPVSAADPLPKTLRRRVPASVEELRTIQKRVRSLRAELAAVTVGVRRGPAQGSGVIISENGYVLTAAHVSGEPGSDVTVVLSDGTHLSGRSLGRHTEIDAGLVKIAEEGDWPVAELGAMEGLHPGDWVIGMGHPGGFHDGRPSVPRLGRLISIQDWVVRTDVALIGGDSGGPLFDLSGRVIGIHSRIGADPNLNFHVPINVYRENWYWLIAAEERPVDARAGGPLLGVDGTDDRLQGRRGCRVTKVFAGLPAAEAGLQAGDLILRLDEHYILGIGDLVAVVNQYDAGDRIELTILRDGRRRSLTVRLGERPARQEQSDGN